MRGENDHPDAGILRRQVWLQANAEVIFRAVRWQDLSQRSTVKECFTVRSAAEFWVRTAALRPVGFMNLRSKKRQEAWIGDAILAAHARTWCLVNLADPHCIANVICSNVNLAGYAKEILLEPRWGGTELEAYIFRLRANHGEDAAKELVYSICQWTLERLHNKVYYRWRDKMLCESGSDLELTTTPNGDEALASRLLPRSPI